VSPGVQLADTKRSWDENRIYMGKLASRYGSGRSQKKDSVVEVGAAVETFNGREILAFDLRIINLTGDTAYYGILVTGRSKEQQEELERLDAIDEKEFNMLQSQGKKVLAIAELYASDETQLERCMAEIAEMDETAKEMEKKWGTYKERKERRQIALVEQPLRLLSPAEAVYYMYGETSEDALMKAQALASIKLPSGANPGPVSSYSYGGYTTYNYHYGALDSFTSGFARGFNTALQWEAIAEAKRAAAIREDLMKASQKAIPIVGVLPAGMAVTGKVWALPIGGPVTLSVGTTTDETLKTIQDVHGIHLYQTTEQMPDSIEK